MQNETQKHSIKHEIKETISLGLPMTASYLIYATSGFIGTAMVARLGKDALAASILVSIIWASLSVFFFGILNAVSVLVSHQHGAKNDKAISDIMGQGYLLGILVCVCLIAILSSMPLFLHGTAQPPQVIHMATQYMRSLLWTVPGLVTLIISEQFLAGIGRAKIIMRMSMLVVPIEIPIIYILIFGKLGMPVCGISGVGYGFAITYTVSAIGLISFLLKANHYKKYRLFSGISKIDFHYIKELIKVGLPLGFMQVIEVSTFAFATFGIARFGTTMLAAHQILMQCLGFAITLVFSMSGAVAIRVGHAVGRKDLLGIKYAIYVGMVLNFICMLVVSIAFYAFPKIFLRLDINIHNPINTTLIHDASQLLAICSVLLLFDNFRIIGAGVLRGLKDTRFTMVASFISFWGAGLSFAYLFGFYFHGEAAGIWWGLTTGIAIGAIINFIRLQTLLPKLDYKKLHSIGNIS